MSTWRDCVVSSDRQSPPLVYLETSMVLAYLKKEEGRWEDCLACIEDVRDGHLRAVTSALTIAEVAKPKGHDATKVPEAVYRQVVDFFKYSWLSVVHVDRRIAEHARTLVRTHNIPGPDAVHLATACVM